MSRIGDNSSGGGGPSLFPIDHDYQLQLQLACYTLTAFYFALLVATGTALSLTIYRENWNWSFATSQKLTFVFIILCCCGRCIFFGLLPDVVSLGVKVFDLLWTLPAVFLFTTFSLLLFHWTKVTFQNSDSEQTRVRLATIVCATINVFTYALQIALFVVLFHFDVNDGTYSQIEPYLLAALFFGATLFVFAFGVNVYRQEVAEVSELQRQVQRRVALVTGIVCTAFTVRAVVNMFWRSIVVAMSRPCFYVFIAVFYTITEVMPLAAVLKLASRVPRQRAIFDDVVTPILSSNAGVNDYNREADYDDEDGYFKDDKHGSMASTSLGGTGFLVGNPDDIVASADRLRASLALSRGLSPTFGPMQSFGDAKMHAATPAPAPGESPMTPVASTPFSAASASVTVTPPVKIANPKSDDVEFD